jgi:hypothetical protein
MLLNLVCSAAVFNIHGPRARCMDPGRGSALPRGATKIPWAMALHTICIFLMHGPRGSALASTSLPSAPAPCVGDFITKSRCETPTWGKGGASRQVASRLLAFGAF